MRVRVADVVWETADACRLVLEPAAEPRFAYRPGQFVTVRVPAEAGAVARCYSLCTAPETDASPAIAVKRVPGGRGSNWLCDNAEAGLELEMLRPAGRFTPSSPDLPLLLFAAGSGITPILSILKSGLHAGRGRFVLVYANRDEHSVIFASTLRRLAAEHPGRIGVVHWLESVQGRPDVAALRELARPYADRDSFVCGPEPFMAAVERALAELDVPPRRVHVERFASLDDDPFLAPEPIAGSGTSRLLRVELDGAVHELDWTGDAPLLDTLLGKGIDAPFSCRQGSCSACACRVVDGQVKMLRNDVLEQEDIDEGYVLACQSVPITDRVHVRYD